MNAPTKTNTNIWKQVLYCAECKTWTPHVMVAFPAYTIKVCDICKARGKADDKQAGA